MLLQCLCLLSVGPNTWNHMMGFTLLSAEVLLCVILGVDNKENAMLFPFSNRHFLSAHDMRWISLQNTFADTHTQTRIDASMQAYLGCTQVDIEMRIQVTNTAVFQHEHTLGTCIGSKNFWQGFVETGFLGFSLPFLQGLADTLKPMASTRHVLDSHLLDKLATISCWAINSSGRQLEKLSWYFRLSSYQLSFGKYEELLQRHS